MVIIIRVAIYLRKSRSDESGEISDTLRIHKSILLETAKKMELNIIKIYEEVVSGDSLFSRPQMLILLEAVENSEYDAVLCMDIDRLGRGGMRDQGIILDTFKYSSTKIITPDKTYDLNDEDDEELTEFKSFMSRRELKIIKKRLSRGLAQTIKSGGYVSNPPYGYSSCTINKIPSLKINKEESEYVKMIFDMYVNKRIGCQLIANFLNSVGAKPHRSNLFGRTSVASIIKNPVYTGSIVRNKSKCSKKSISGENKATRYLLPKDKWEYYIGLHQPIITEETFHSAQKIMNSRRNSPQKSNGIKNSLAGIVRCSKCGLYMQRTVAQNKYIYLSCPTKGCCSSAKLIYVEDSLKEILNKIFNSVYINYSSTNKLPTENEHLKKLLYKEQDKCNTQLNNLCNLLEQGVYDSKTYLHRKKLIGKNISKINEQIELLNKLSANKTASNKNKILPSNILDIYDICSPKEKNYILKCFILEVTYNKEKQTVPLDFELSVKLKNI